MKKASSLYKHFYHINIENTDSISATFTAITVIESNEDDRGCVGLRGASTNRGCVCLRGASTDRGCVGLRGASTDRGCVGLRGASAGVDDAYVHPLAPQYYLSKSHIIIII